MLLLKSVVSLILMFKKGGKFVKLMPHQYFLSKLSFMVPKWKIKLNFKVGKMFKGMFIQILSKQSFGVHILIELTFIKERSKTKKLLFNMKRI